MKPPPFSYHKPASLPEALQMLGQYDNAKALAGGQSLMPMMAYRYVLPDHLIDLNRCDELFGVKATASEIEIGAMTRQRDLQQDPIVIERLPLIADALEWVGHIQTRNRGTIGGSLSHLDPAAELPAALFAYNARLIVQRCDEQREIDMAQWTLGYMMPNLQSDELLTAIRIPHAPANHCHAFVEVARRHGDFAQAGAGVVVELHNGKIHDARIALAGVDVGPVRLLEAEGYLRGQRPDVHVLAGAAEFARNVPGFADVHADEIYRKRLAVVVTRRALEKALSVGKGDSDGD